MNVPYGVCLNTLDNPAWKALPEGYNITYQPIGNSYAFLAHNDHIEPSCRHFKRMVDSVFITKEYKTYGAARRAILEHSRGCTKAYYPDSKVGIIILHPVSL